jgi:hypothetical protein
MSRDFRKAPDGKVGGGGKARSQVAVGKSTLTSKLPAGSAAAAPAKKKKPSHDDGPDPKHDKAAEQKKSDADQPDDQNKDAQGDDQHDGLELAPSEPTIQLGDAELADEMHAEAELAETTAWLAQTRVALAQVAAEIHVCHAGCVHGQFDRMLQGYATPGLEHLEPGAMEDAIARWKAKKKGVAPPANDPSAATPPDLATPGTPDAGDQTANVGTVSPGKPGSFPGLMGVATWNFAASKMPDLKVNTTQDPTDKSWTAKIATTTSSDATASAIATPAGTYALAGVDLVDVTDDNTGKTTKVAMKKQIVVDAAAAAQIKAAEQEHLDDITRAYTITTKAAEAAVNTQAASSFNDPKKSDAIAAAKKAVADALDPKLTANPATWIAMLTKTSNLTKSGRDDSKWHTFNYTANGSDIDLDAKMVTYRVQNNPNVGTTTSAALITL